MKNFFGSKRNIIIFVSVVIIALATVVAVFISSKTSTNSAKDDKKILKGITVSGDDVSSLTIDEAKAKITKIAGSAENLVLHFKYNEITFSVNAQDILLKPEIDKAVSQAYAIGRSKDAEKNKKDRKTLKEKTIDIPMTYSFDEDKFMLVANEYLASYISDVADMQVEIVGDGLVVTNATKGNGIDVKKLRTSIEKELKDYAADSPIVLEFREFKGKNLTFEEFKKEYIRDAKDAVYTQKGESYTIEPEVIGVDFDLKEAKKIFDANKSSDVSYKIPAKITYPAVTAKALEDKYVNKILASYSTSFAGSSQGRCINISLAASKINGHVLNPGERFSYNGVVGPRTEAAGFKMAHVYVGNQVVDGIGGGICQVSSTLYNAQVMADLKTVSRTNHSIPVSYVPMGRDATVAYGSIDYVFENNKSYPVVIKAEISGTTLTVSIVGTQAEDYTVEFISSYNSGIAYSTVKTEDSTLDEGTEKVITKGSNGSVYDSYRVYKRNGTEFDRKYESKSRYVPTNQQIAVGTKKPEPPVEDKPEENTSGTETEKPLPETGDENGSASAQETAEKTESAAEIADSVSNNNVQDNTDGDTKEVVSEVQ